MTACQRDQDSQKAHPGLVISNGSFHSMIDRQQSASLGQSLRQTRSEIQRNHSHMGGPSGLTWVTSRPPRRQVPRKICTEVACRPTRSEPHQTKFRRTLRSGPKRERSRSFATPIHFCPHRKREEVFRGLRRTLLAHCVSAVANPDRPAARYILFAVDAYLVRLIRLLLGHQIASPLSHAQ